MVAMKAASDNAKKTDRRAAAHLQQRTRPGAGHHQGNFRESSAAARGSGLSEKSDNRLLSIIGWGEREGAEAVFSRSTASAPPEPGGAFARPRRGNGPSPPRSRSSVFRFSGRGSYRSSGVRPELGKIAKRSNATCSHHPRKHRFSPSAPFVDNRVPARAGCRTSNDALVLEADPTNRLVEQGLTFEVQQQLGRRRGAHHRHGLERRLEARHAGSQTPARASRVPVGTATAGPHHGRAGAPDRRGRPDQDHRAAPDSPAGRQASRSLSPVGRACWETGN